MPPLEPTPEAARPPDKLKVLVVDDNQSLAKTLGWMVELLGHEVQVTYDGATVLGIAKSFLPDVILLDIGLSGMSGYEVCQQIRSEPILKQCVVVAQTGWSQAEHRQRSKEAGFDYHFVKPIRVHTLEELFSTLGKRTEAGTE